VAKLLVVVRPDDPISELPASPNLVIGYTREIPKDSPTDPDIRAAAQRIIVLSRALEGQVELSDYAPATPVQLAITTSQGVMIQALTDLAPERTGADDAAFVLRQRLAADAVNSIRKALTPKNPPTTRVLERAGGFVIVGGGQVDFRAYTLLVGPLSDGELSNENLAAVFGTPQFRTAARQLPAEELAALSALRLDDVHTVPLTLQGRFDFAIPIDGTEIGWLWVLSGPIVFVGLQAESDLTHSKSITILLALPGTQTPADARPPSPGASSPSMDGNPSRPIDATEDELLGNPDLFSDDPGSYCQPFRNPNRIVGERAFHTILRVTQPEIGGEPSVPPPDALPPFPFTPGLNHPIRFATRDAATGIRSRADRMPFVPGVTSLVAELRDAGGESPMVSTRAAVAERRRYVLTNSRGRATLNTQTALEWEGDSSIYQATSLGLGHILEFRVRWRSNGYSLGNVAHTLTLAPRQAKRILTVESRILDRVRREESTRAAERVTQETQRDYAYNDAVQSHLSEWARGGSKASTTGVAGGAGFAMAGFVIGGGAAHGQSNSSSWQQGGRNVSASEEQSLRDAIRQYGESLRKLDSMVVVEQSQEEFVQAVSEVIRNPNYCHALTIIYHEILRHLRVDTEIVGARECVFVPLAIRPFTLERVLRWREPLERGLRKPDLQWVMRYLEDVNEDFASGTIPEGRRSQQPIRFLTGSVYLQLAIERPRDNDDKTLNEANWQWLAPHLRSPMRQIFARLQQAADAERDLIFQRDNAPTIAASWVNGLQLNVAANRPLTGTDFTLATHYQFNRTLRVDFTYTPDGSLTREDLQHLMLSVPVESQLPPKSVANVKRVEIHYYTDTFDRQESSPNHMEDLVTVATGLPDANGASVFIKLSDWERQDLRNIIRGATQDLITHLNEHIEYYHKLLWWNLDRDKLYMMLDSVYVLSPEDGRSVASVVEREPIAIMGNSLVYRAAGGAFIGADGHPNPEALNRYYRDAASPAEPLRVSLPTSGLYAQSVMDECEACEEHSGSTDWVLTDKEPELAELTMAALASRRATPPEAVPSQFPASIINLQNVPNVPPPSGFGDVLSAVQNAQAFRDMAGLAGTQANARAAMETAASMATQFAAKAVELRKAELAAKLAKEKLAVVDKAENSGGIDQQEKKTQTKRILDEMNPPPKQQPKLTQEPVIESVLARGGPFSTTRSDDTGVQTIQVGMASDDRLAMHCQYYRGLALYWETIKSKMVTIAQDEFKNVWNSGARKETDATMHPIIEKYWREGVFEGGALDSLTTVPATSWSAAFIAWVVKQAGGGDRFARVGGEKNYRPKFRPRAHWRYTAPALKNKLALSTINPFWAYAIDEKRPEVGDIVVKSRNGSGLTLNLLTNLTGEAADGNVGWESHGDIVTAVNANSITAIGGNVDDSVSESTYPLDAAGFVQSTGGANDDHCAIVRIDTDQYYLPECEELESRTLFA